MTDRPHDVEPIPDQGDLMRRPASWTHPEIELSELRERVTKLDQKMIEWIDRAQEQIDRLGGEAKTWMDENTATILAWNRNLSRHDRELLKLRADLDLALDRVTALEDQAKRHEERLNTYGRYIAMTDPKGIIRVAHGQIATPPDPEPDGEDNRIHEWSLPPTSHDNDIYFLVRSNEYAPFFLDADDGEDAVEAVVLNHFNTNLLHLGLHAVEVELPSNRTGVIQEKVIALGLATPPDPSPGDEAARGDQELAQIVRQHVISGEWDDQPERMQQKWIDGIRAVRRHLGPPDPAPVVALEVTDDLVRDCCNLKWHMSEDRVRATLDYASEYWGALAEESVCPVCKGAGYESQSIDDYGASERLTCERCEGTGTIGGESR